MLKATMRYGAVRAKVMAMQGKLLTEDDFSRLCECTGLSDIVSYLRGHRGWGDIIAELPTPVTPDRLVRAVSERVWRESEKLYRFSNIDDKTFLRFSLCRGEYTLILAAMRRLISEDSGGDEASYGFYRIKSSVDTTALANCKNWEELLDAVSGSIFEGGLRKLTADPDTRLPNYREASVLLENTYYREVFSYISKKYAGLGKMQLEELLGREADLLNIISLLRLQRYFPGSLEKADRLLIPIHYRLSPALTEAIIRARNEAEALELLKKSKYGQSFSDISGSRLESVYENAMSGFCRKLIRVAEPSVCTAQAYLALKEIECKRLLRVIEAVKCGIDPEKAL